MLAPLQSTSLGGVFVTSSVPVGDERGRFSRLFCSGLLAEAHGSRAIVQINHSLTRAKGSVRGLHFQTPPFAEGKWVRCLKGRIHDVAVDLRRGSPTFLHHTAVELSEARSNAIFIPEGCAHGFQTLEEDCELLYLHTAPYAPANEGGLRWDDPLIGIVWPLAITEISARDKTHALLSEDYPGIAL